MEDECGTTRLDGAMKHKWHVVSAVRDYPKGCEGSSKKSDSMIGEEERTEMSTRAALEAFRRANPNHRLISPHPQVIRPITNRSTKGPSRNDFELVSKCNGRSVTRMIVHGLTAAPNCSWKRASTSISTSGVKNKCELMHHCKEKRPNIKTTYSVCD